MGELSRDTDDHRQAQRQVNETRRDAEDPQDGRCPGRFSNREPAPCLLVVLFS
jgi:hypothetical protein